MKVWVRSGLAKRQLLFWAVAATAAVTLLAQSSDDRPGRRLTGLLRLWGDASLGELAARWQKGFREQQPGMRLEISLRGNDSAIGGLYMGVADVALMGRDALPIELEGYRQIRNEKPFVVKAGEHVWIFVNREAGKPLDPRVEEFLRYVANRADSPREDAAFVQDLEPYVAGRQVSGTIRNWGNNYIPGLVRRWEDGFRSLQPAVRFETNLQGSEASMAGLYAGVADLAFIGREMYEPEGKAFEERFGYQPLGIEISSGSFATPHKTFALMVFVQRDNPLTGMTMAQVAAVFGERQAAHTWGELGLTGPWAGKPIHVYGYSFDTGMANFFRMRVLQDGDGWNPRLMKFDNRRTAGGEVINAGKYVMEALAKDPYGIGYANVQFANTAVKTVPLAGADGKFVVPTKENVWRRAYPLTRFTTVYVNRPPGQPVEPRVKEFLRYILSKDGMQAVVDDGAYLPLTREVIREQLRKLE